MDIMKKRHFFPVLLLAAGGALSLAGCSDSPKEKPTEAPPVRVEVLTMKAAPASGLGSYSATVEEESGTAVSFATAGTVSRIYVEAGQTVGRGARVADLDPLTARNAHEAALAVRRQAEDAYARMKQLHEAGSLSDIDWMEVQSKLSQAVSSEQIARKGLSDCQLTAPCAGYVSVKAVEPGQNVLPGQQVVRIVQIDRVKVTLSVPEDEIAGVSEGQAVSVSVAALGGRTFAGRVTERGVEADPLSRSYRVKALLQNPGHVLLPGMVCEARIEPSRSASASADSAAFLLPAPVVQIDIDNRPFVWTVANGRAHKTYIEVGPSVGERVTVAAGLGAGSCVIVAGQQKVSEGTRVSIH